MVVRLHCVDLEIQEAHCRTRKPQERAVRPWIGLGLGSLFIISISQSKRCINSLIDRLVSCLIDWLGLGLDDSDIEEKKKKND